MAALEMDGTAEAVGTAVPVIAFVISVSLFVRDSLTWLSLSAVITD
jgi:hypothetical protein